MLAKPVWLFFLRRYWVIPTVVLWKLVLIGGWSLPVPASDAYFFDGAVIHWILHGHYINPPIAGLFPTSGTLLFSAYPPGYQVILAVWMLVFGPTLVASMWLHGILYATFAALLLHLLVRERVRPAAVNLAGAFLLVLTFHDRPDSFAQVLGLAGLVCWTRPGVSRRFQWLGAGLIGATLLTSLHIGAMYAAMTWAWVAIRQPVRAWPWGAMLLMAALPAVTALLILWRWPAALDGFLENVVVTPSYTGWRFPLWDEILRVVRNTLGWWLVAGELVWRVVRRRPLWAASRRTGQLFAVGFAAAGIAVGASLCIVSSNYVWVAAYAQALVVGLWWHGGPTNHRWRVTIWVPGLALISLRAVALSTWGIYCAQDVSRAEAHARVAAEVARLPPGEAAVISSAMMYAVAGDATRPYYHTDWMGGLDAAPDGAPARLFIFTSMEYHRRFGRELQDLADAGRWRIVSVEEPRLRPIPEDFPRYRRIVQHLSWSPVIVWVERL